MRISTRLAARVATSLIAACTLSTLFIGVMQVGAAPFAPTMPVSAQAQQPRYTHKNISVLHMSAARR